MLLFSGVARAAPSCPATPAEANTSAQQAVDAFARMDGPGFETSRDTLEAQLTCLSASPDPRQAALVHLVEALAAYRAKDMDLAVLEFQAMHESDPTFVLPSEVAPPGGPVQSRDAQAQALAPAVRMPHGISRWVYVDGREAADLPTSRPALVVVMEATAQPLWSGLLAAGASLPAQVPRTPLVNTETPWGDTSTPNGPVRLSDRPAVPEARRARPLLLSAGASAIATGVTGALYVSAFRQVRAAGDLITSNADDADWRAEGFDGAPSESEVLDLLARARGYEIGTQVAAGLTLGLGAAWVVVRW